MKNNIITAVEKFYKIRNIPYHIPLNENEENYDCEGKNKLLAEELKKLGYKVRGRVGLLRWSEQKLPKTILELSHEDESSHYFLEVIPPGKDHWIIVDATWNPELEKAGFKIAEWDGVSSTLLAFSCYKILPQENTEEYLNKIAYKKDLEINRRLYQRFNQYCDSFLERSKL